MELKDIKKRLDEIDVVFRTSDNPHVRNCSHLIELFGAKRLEWKGKAPNAIQVEVKDKGLLDELLEMAEAHDREIFKAAAKAKAEKEKAEKAKEKKK